MSIDHIVRRSCVRIKEVILIGDNTTLLNYGHQFIRVLHVVGSRAWTRVILVVIS